MHALDLPATPSIQWSICAIDLSDGTTLLDHSSATVLRMASVGKILLLIEVARGLASGELDPARLLTRCADDAVADSGLWQHLSSDTLPIVDVAALIGAMSDNLATNVLLREIGLSRVDRVADDLGLASTRLLDRVRDVRTKDDPPALSTGSAADLAQLLGQLSTGQVYSPEVSRQVMEWLSWGTDLSMVAAAFGLDPLAHLEMDRNLMVKNKTGTNAEVRADVGVVHGRRTSAAYAVIANGTMSQGPDRDTVLATMRAIGEILRQTVS
ncbi:MAG TPA: serine hydrolase [Propionibacteriaceae bacterium]